MVGQTAGPSRGAEKSSISQSWSSFELVNEMKKCPNCDKGTLRATEQTLHDEVNGHVFTANVIGEVCGTCGEVLIDGRDIERFELGVVGALLDAGDDSPEVFRLARKTLGLTATDLAGMLRVTAETISRWENGKHSIDSMALAILALLVRDAANGSTATQEALRARTLAKPLGKSVALKIAS
jgi:putative zinc finger/helix-turn-helix YgiT family protein